MKIGASFNAPFITENIFQQYKEAGIEYMEVSCSYIDDYDKIDFPKIKELSEKYGVKLWSYHLPFFPFEEVDISSKCDEIRKKSIGIYRDHILKAATIGIDKFIIHPSAEPYTDDEREEHIQIAAQSLKTLSEIAQSVGGVLCVENLPRTCLSRSSADMLKLISLDNNIMVCFDTNHLLIEDLFVFINRLANRIVTIHVSDYDFINERHWLPGEGKLDFYKIYKSLLDIGYTGIWNYEVSPFKISTETIQRTKAIDLKDFYKNAMEIFSGEPLTVYGTPTV